MLRMWVRTVLTDKNIVEAISGADCISASSFHTDASGLRTGVGAGLTQQ